MEIHKNIVKEEPIVKASVQNVSETVPKDRTDETAIFTTTEQGSTMFRSGNRWCEDTGNLNGGRPMHFLLDKHRPSSEKTRETNNLFTRTSKTTVGLDKAPGEEFCVYSHSINNFLEERPSEGKEDCIRSVIGRLPGNQTKDVGNSTRSRPKEPDVSAGREWESDDTNKTLGLRQLCRNQFVAPVIPVEAGPFNKDTHNFNSNTTKNGFMPQLSEDDGFQCGKKDLPELLSLLKDKYMYHDETNKNILYDYEIERFAELYCITDFRLVLSCHDSIFWLKDPDGVIYMWSRIDGMMIRGGRDMKEALINFLFYEENLYYIEECTLKWIQVKKAKEEAKKWYEENKHTTIIDKIVVTDELLKPLEEKKNESNKGKKRQRRKNKH